MRVLITGAGGMLGSQVASAYKALGAEVYPFNRKELNICDAPALKTAFHSLKPTLVVNCAAYTAVDQAEEDKETAFLVNGLGPKYIACLCRDIKAVFVHISTDYVFNGKSNSPYGVYEPTDPVNIYGKSKLFGEQAIREAYSRYFIIRTSWLFGPGGKNFVDTFIKLCSKTDPIKIVNDQTSCPTYTVDLAQGIVKLAQTGVFGTYHLTNSGHTTWYGLALKIKNILDLKKQVVPCSSEDFPRPARRPEYSVLDPFPLPAVTSFKMPGWQDALRRYLREYAP